jgi:8-oxo-dGTP diphosphatase
VTAEADELVLNAAVTTDLVVLTIASGALQVLLVKRARPPFRGRWALPGGFVLPNEDLAGAAARELREETGMVAPSAHLEQLASYGAPKRDPRGRIVTVAYLALMADLPEPVADTDAADAGWHPVDVDARPRLAFDHETILGDGVERARAKLEYSSLAASFLTEPFTLSDLRRVYEIVWGSELEASNFRRKVLATEGFVVPTGGSAPAEGRGRPAALYRRGEAVHLNPPILRP